MASGDSLKISVDAHGNAVDELKRVRREMQRNESALKELTNASGDLSESLETDEEQSDGFTGSLERLWAAGSKAAVVLGTIGVGAKALFDIGQQGAAFEDQVSSIGRSFGTFEVLAVKAKAATSGMFSNEEILEAASTFEDFGLSTELIPDVLAEVAKTSVRTGKDMGGLLDSLTEGITKTSDMRLDNVGLLEVFKRARVELDATGAAYTDQELRAVGLRIATEDLAKANSEIDLNKQMVTPYKALAATMSDLVTDFSRYVALNLSEYQSLTAQSVRDQRDAFDETALSLERITRTVNIHSGAVAAGMDHQADLISAMSEQQGLAKGLAVDLTRLPLAEQDLALTRLGKTFGKQGKHVVELVRHYAGLDSSMKSATHSAQLLLHELAVKPPSMAWWDDWVGDVTEGLDKFNAGQKKRNAGAWKQIKAAREAAAEQLKVMRRDNKHALNMQALTGELARIDEISRHAKEKHAARMEKLADKGVKAATITKLSQEFTVKHGMRMQELRDAAIKADNERGKAAALQAIQQGAALKLARIEVQLADAVAPLERARLEVMKARIQASLTLRTLSDNETEAAAQRLNAQMQLNAAMSTYNQELARASSAGWAEGLSSVSDAMSGISARAGGLGEIGQGLASVSDAVGSSSGIWAQYAEGQAGVGEAVSGTIGVLSDAAGSFIDDEQAKAAVASAFEVASSIASFATGDIAGGIAHAAAATAFAAVAAGAGGGGAAATAGGSGGASAGASGGDNQQGGFGDTGGRQVIVQFGSGVILGSAAAVGSAIKQAEYANRGTGQAAGY